MRGVEEGLGVSGFLGVRWVEECPRLPKCHGDASYIADKKLHTLQTDGCRKASFGHPTLPMGIFTI